MTNAPLPSRLASQNHQGGGVRFFGRFGGVVRGVIASSIALTARLHRATTTRHNRNPPTPQTPPSPPSSRRQAAPRRPRTTTPVPSAEPARSGWLARWFGRGRHQPAASDRPAFGDTPVTQEAFPELPPEIRAFLDTPITECNPDAVLVLLALFAERMAPYLPPERGEGRQIRAQRHTPDHTGHRRADHPPAASPQPRAMARQPRRATLLPLRRPAPRARQGAMPTANAAPVSRRLCRASLTHGAPYMAYRANAAANGATLWRSRNTDSRQTSGLCRPSGRQPRGVGYCGHALGSHSPPGAR